MATTPFFYTPDFVLLSHSIMCMQYPYVPRTIRTNIVYSDTPHIFFPRLATFVFARRVDARPYLQAFWYISTWTTCKCTKATIQKTQIDRSVWISIPPWWWLKCEAKETWIAEKDTWFGWLFCRSDPSTRTPAAAAAPCHPNPVANRGRAAKQSSMEACALRI